MNKALYTFGNAEFKQYTDTVYIDLSKMRIRYICLMLRGSQMNNALTTLNCPSELIFIEQGCLSRLHARFGDHVRFVMVNVREAHPGKAVPQPQALDEKTEHAEQLRDLYGFEFEVAVGDIDGTLHRALSPKPNSAYILGKDGTILFRAQWANDTKALAEALEAIAAGESPRRSQSGGLVRPMLRFMRDVAPVLDRAGGGAWGDMWLVAPPMAATAFALKTLRIRPPKHGAR